MDSHISDAGGSTEEADMERCVDKWKQAQEDIQQVLSDLVMTDDEQIKKQLSK